MDYLRSAKVLLIDDNDDVLVLRRSNTHPRAPGIQDLPGGAVEDEESHIEGALRELSEESGVTLSQNDVTLGDIYKHRIEATDQMIERSVFVARIKGERPAVVISEDEHDTYDWIPLVGLNGLQPRVQEQIDRIVKSGVLKTI